MNAAAFSPYDDALFTDSMLTKPVAPTGESWQAYAQRYLADLSKFNDYFGAFDPRFLPYAKKAGLVGLALTAADTALALQRGDAKGAIGNLTELVLGTVTGVAVGAVTTALALSPIVATAVGVAAVAGVVWGVGKLFDPLVIDLDQDGIELRPLQASEVLFDMRANGTLQATAWVGADDGILVQDMNGDGQINNLTELFSESHTPGISTGLGALADLDRNFDGVLDAQDAAYADVRVWRDLNQNGVADEGELATLAETGVVSIELNAQHVEEQDADGNVIRSRFTFTGDGVLNAGGEMAEAALMSAETGFTLLGASNGVNRYQSPDGTVFGIAENDAPLSLDLAPAGLNAVIGGAGADSFSAGGSAPVAMDGGAGADTLTGGDGADYLVGGGGADQLFGGAGDDVLVIHATTALVNGGAGRDTVIVSGTGGVVLDLAAAQVEEFYGGAGNDTITAAGSAEALYVTGGAGQDALSAGAGDDTLVGGLGDDTLAGGAGTDSAVYQGRQADYQITTNADGSITVVDTNTADGIDEGADTLTGIERLSFADGIIHTDGTNNAPAAGAVAFAERGAGALLMTAAQLLANSSDPDGDALRILAVGKAVNGTVMLTANGDVMFKPADGFVGQAGFEFTVSDGNGGQSRARASISCGLAEPTDTHYARQWHLQAINVVDVWDDYTGAGVLVGINDFGVDPNHPDYAGNYDTAKDWDYAHGDGDPTPQQSTHNQNHGTAMAGLIGAQRNGQGMVGVAYGATLAGFWQNGRSYAGQQNVDVSANFSGPLGWATDSSGAKIRNPLNTIYSPDGIDAQQAAELNAAVTQGRAGLGTVVVNSAGNDQDFEEDSNSFYPFNARQTIAVGALDTTGKMAAFSLSGANVLVSAPGVNCLCTDRPGAAGYEDGTQTISDPAYYFGSGTCPAAGIVAGVAALMLEANPALGWRDVQEILAYSAWQSDAAASGLQTNGAKNWNGGGLVSGAQGGFGMVDARAAVRLAETWISQGTSANEASLTQSRSVALAIPDGGAGGVSDTCTVSTGLNIDHVEVAVNIGHANIGDLEIILTSPDGTKSVLLNRPEVDPTVPNSAGASEDGINWTFMSTRHWGETGAGQWTLTVKDLRSGNTGTLNNWSLKLYGDALSADDTYIYTVDYAGFTGDANAGRRLLTDSGGLDTINAAAVNAAALIDLHAGAAGRIAGNAFGIAAGSVIENAFSGDGDDTLIGNEAANWLRAGRGNDVLEGGLGADTLDGGSGDDTVSYEHSSASVAVNLANGTGLGGEAAGDVLLQVENLVGSHYGDALTGDSQANWLEGGVGSDTLSGGAGHDLLEGGEGADRLLGEEGDDTLFGAAGDDTLEGGAGTDTAVFRGYASEYTVTTVNGVTTVSGADGVDTLTGVELLRFADTERSVTPNGAPTATAASLSGAEDQGISLLVSDLLGLASDPDNDVLSFLGVESPSHGAVALTASGTVIFVPEKDYVGEAGFSYRVSDGRGGESSARVSITLGAVNDAPAAVLSVVALAAGQSVAGQLAATDADDTPSALRYTLQTSAGHGSVSLGEDGAYVYTANAGYAGADTFSYTVTDASGAAVVGQVAVQVAGPSRAGQTFQVNTASRQNIGTDIETSIALAPSVAALSGGRFVVAWAAADADGYGVWCNVFDAGGNPLGQERRVNTWTEKDQSHVSVSSLSGGGYVVAWASEGQNGPYTSIQAQRFDDAGVPQGGEFRVNASAQSENLMPVVTGMADGGFMIAWSGYQADGDNWGACARRFDASGIAQGGDILLNTTSQDIQSMPQIASLAGGHFVAVWQSNLQDGSSTGVYAQMFDAKGGKIGGELQINTWTDDYQGAPQVVSLAGGGFVVAWTSYFEDMSYHGIYARRFGEDGSPLGPEFIVNEDDRAGSQLYPRLAALPDGGFAVSWASYNNALVNQRSFLADGTPASSFVTRGSFNGTEYAAPTLAALDNGETVVVWQTAATQTAPTELRAQISGQYGSSFASMYLSGSDGNDTLQGAEAADILRGRQGRDMLSGGAGDDILDGGAGADTLSGGAGEDTASYKYSGQAVQVNLLSGLAQGGDAEGDSLQSIENVQGSGFGDTLTGDAGANRLEGGAGADSLYGGAGDDTLVIDRADLDSGILDGGEGLDTLRVVEDGGGYVLKLAGRGIEQAFGSNGADTIIGDGQHNGLHGGAGADVLSGAGGNDTLDGGAGNDALSGDDGADVLTGGEGMDYLSGGEGADSLSGGAGDDVLLGGAGNDTLRGDGGWDILAGGAGSDTLEGCNAGETYHFNAGDGDDTLRPNGVLGSFSFGPGISMEDLHCAGSGDDLTIFYPGGSITIPGFMSLVRQAQDNGSGNNIAGSFSFADGSAYDFWQFLQMVAMQQGTDGADVLTGHPLMPGELYGLGGDDTLTGYEGDYLDGGAGNDVLYGAKYGSMQGGTGNDTMHGSAEDDYYRFEAGDGADTVIDSTGYDSFSFGPGITPDDVTLSLEGGALLLTYPGGSITLANSLGIRSAGAGWTEFDFSIDGVQFDDGSYWEQADILSRLYQRVDGTDGADAISADSLMAQQIYGGAGDDAITGSGAASFLCGEAGNDSISGGAGNELLLGGEGDDTLAGGAGNDSLVGGEGNDVFLFQRGDGVDRIFVADSGVVELPSEGGDSGGESVPKTDAIEFGADIDPSDVVMSRSGTDLVLRIKGTQDALTVDGYFSGGEENPQTMVEEIRFADGTVWNALTIRNATAAGTDTADTLYGNNWSGGVLSGLGGDDTLNGGDADETLLGGEGNDMLSGGRGSDLLDGGAGNDTINPGSGYKTIAFGRGSGHDFVLKHRDSSWGWSYRDILIGAGLGPDDLTFQTQGQNLLITINDTGDELVLEGALEGDVIQCSLEFEGGVYWGGYDIANRIVSAQELTLTGTSGYDTLTGGWGDDSLLGLGGDDNLAGGTGNDTLDGGAGSDNLDGGFGRDVYLYNRGYGNDYATYCTAGTPDLVQLGAGLRPEDIELGLYHYNMGGLILDLASFQLSDCGWSMFTMRGAGPQTSSYPQSLTASAILEWTSSPMDDLYIKVRDTSEYLTLSNYDFTNGAVPYEGGPKLEGIRFSDGQFWDWQTIKSKVQISTEGADTILGFGDADLIHGKGGNDLIHGGDGNDTLYGDDGDDVINGGYGLDKVYGGAGNDTLAGSWLDGGEGNDTYQGGYQSTFSFGRGSGHDKAVNGYACTVELKEGLDSESIAVTRGGAGNADLILTIKDTGDTLTMQGWFSRLSSPALRAVQFQDGTQWSPAMLTGQANGHAPVVQEALADAVAPEDAAFSLTLPASAFVDVDAGSVLSYTAHLADGQPLPAWLSFNAATRTFSGTPGAGEIGSLAIKVLATDQFGACASQAFALEVSPVNDAPVPGPQVSLGALAENGGSVTFSEGQLLANATDEEGSALTAQGLAVSADQGSLVNNGDGSWTFTPAAGFSGLATVSYLVSDGEAFSPASAAITVTPVNDLLSGGAGNDTLAGGGGNNLLHAGTGDDSLGAGSGNNIYVGGAGADALATGAGRNVILFNKGDGTDAVISSDTGQDDTLSLGGGICQTDVSLSKSGDDLVLSDGAGGSLAFKDWYASGASARKSVLNLQIIEEAATEFDAGSANALVDNKVETFNFAGIVSAFDAALAENSALSSWAISNALAANSLGGSDTAALGGDFAQQYGTCGNFSAMGQSAAQRVLSDAACGASAQTFQSPTALQEGAFKLS